jgi:hypothetical protein
MVSWPARDAAGLTGGFPTGAADFCAEGEAVSFCVAGAIFDFFTKAMEPSICGRLEQPWQVYGVGRGENQRANASEFWKYAGDSMSLVAERRCASTL